METRRHIAKVVPYAALNHLLEEEALCSWMEELSGMGVDGVFLHPRVGLLTPYLSKAWMDRICLCVERAAELGIEAWLYDEFPYPSGAAGGALLAKHPEMAEKHLKVVRVPLSRTQRSAVIASTHGNRIVEAFALQKAEGQTAHFQRVTDEVGIVGDTWFRTEWDSRFYYDPAYAKVYDCPRSNCYLPQYVWEDTGNGAWDELVVFLEVRDSTRRAFGEYVDVSSATTAEAFIALTHEAYKKRLAPYFGSVIPGIFTDEPKYHHPLPWSEPIKSEWTLYNENPNALLSLVEDLPASTEVRQDYRATYARLFLSNWTGTLSEWSENHGLAYCGHISPEEEWLAEATLIGSILKNLRKFHIPGCDLIIPAIGDREHPILNLVPSLAASAAAQEGRTHALCEFFACSDFSLTLQDMKRISDWMSLFGINFFVPHCVFFSIDGERKFDAPPTFSWPSTLQPFFKYWADSARDSSSQLGPSNVVADVLIVRPNAHICSAPEIRSAENRAIYERGMALAEKILDRGLMFHWVDDDEIPELTARGSQAVFHKAAYRHVVYLDRTLPADFLSHLKDLEAEGVDIITETDLDRLPCPLTKATGLVRVVPARNGRWFAVNPGSEPVHFVLEGKSYSLEGYAGQWLRESTRQNSPTEKVSVLDSWKVSPPTENCLPLKHWTINGRSAELAPFYKLQPEQSEPFVESTLGPIPAAPDLEEPVRLTYRTGFFLEAAMQLRLVLEKGAMNGSWTAFLNDRPLESWTHTPAYDRFNLQSDLGVLPAGRHELRFEFTIGRSTEGMTDFCRLFGNFQVRDAFDVQPQLMAPGSLPIHPSDWAASGYPFYSGEMVYETDFEWGESADRIFCEASAPLCDQAMVWLNDHLVGILAWAPWQIELTEFLSPGTNRLRLHLSNSLSNMIYASPRQSGFGDAQIQLRSSVADLSPTERHSQHPLQK